MLETGGLPARPKRGVGAISEHRPLNIQASCRIAQLERGGPIWERHDAQVL